MRYYNDEIAHEKRMAIGQIITAGVLLVILLFIPIAGPFYWIAMGLLVCCVLLGVFDLWVIKNDPGDPPFKDDLDQL